jgi:hypothetical protein
MLSFKDFLDDDTIFNHLDKLSVKGKKAFIDFLGMILYIGCKSENEIKAGGKECIISYCKRLNLNPKDTLTHITNSHYDIFSIISSFDILMKMTLLFSSIDVIFRNGDISDNKFDLMTAAFLRIGLSEEYCKAGIKSFKFDYN